MPQFNEENNSAPSLAETIRLHKKAGTLNNTVTFFEEETKAPAPKPADMGFFERTSDDFRALTRGEFSVKDVLKQVPKNAVKVPVKIAQTVAPALSKFVDVTGSIFGEGLAYAFDDNVRKQYRAGNLDILPTITNTTIPKLAKYTIAAGLEAAIFRSLPNVAKLKLTQMAGVGAIEGIGFAITEGMAKDETPEEIIKKFPLYGISGGALAVLAPYMLPLLKSEVKYLPTEFRKMFGKVEEQIAEETTKKLSVGVTTPEWTAVPVKTPNKRYHAYLRSQGYEPYMPDSELPTIQGGPAVNKTNELPNLPEGRKEPVLNVDDLEAPKVSSPEVTTPKTNIEVEEEYLRSQGYEPYTPDSELPVIKGGPKVNKSNAIENMSEGRATPALNSKTMTSPKVSSPQTEEEYLLSQGYEPYTPDSKLPVIQANKTGQGESTVPKKEMDNRDISYVYNTKQPQKAQADIATNKPETVSVKTKDGTTKTYVKTNPVDNRDITYDYNVQSPKKSQADVASNQPKTVKITADDGTTKTYVKSQTTFSTPNITKGEEVAVPSRQLPVGEGEVAISRLEKRMSEVAEAPQPNLTGERTVTYQAMVKKEQVRKAAEYVTANPEEAMAVLRGEKSPPEGILDNAIALALAKQAENAGDAALAVRLASLRSTRAGQEISFLTEVDPDSAVSAIETIIKARKDKAVRTSKGKSVQDSVNSVKKEAKEVLSQAQLKISEVDKLINDILC